MALSKFKVAPCELVDMLECVNILHEVFHSDPVMIYQYPDSDPGALREKSLRQHEIDFNAPGTHFFKVTCEETGKIVAYSKWLYPHTPTNPFSSIEAFERALHNDPPFPGSNNDVMIKFSTEYYRGKQKWYSPETDYYMGPLAVRLEYQRMGIGALLVAHGLELVDKHNVKTYVQASPAGLGLYLKYGWIEVEELIFDLSPYGGPTEVKTVLMTRGPKARTSPVLRTAKDQ